MKMSIPGAWPVPASTQADPVAPSRSRSASSSTATDSGPPGIPADKRARQTDRSPRSRPPSASLGEAVLGRGSTAGERLGMTVAHDFAVASTAVQGGLDFVNAQTGSAMPLAGSATVWYAGAKVHDVVGQMSGKSPNVKVAAFEAVANVLAAPAAVVVVAGVTAAVAERVVGPNSYFGRLADLAEIQNDISPEQEKRMIGLLDGLRHSVKDESSADALGPHLLSSLYALNNLFEPGAGGSRARKALESATELNAALGLTDRSAIGSFWAAQHAECQKIAAPTSGG